LKAAVLKFDWADPQLNPKLREFDRHYDTTILPCVPRTPEHKEMVSYCASYELFSVLRFPPVPVLSHFDFGDNFFGRSLVKVVIYVAEPTSRKQAGFSPIVDEARFAL
jgi:hypothetical protein